MKGKLTLRLAHAHALAEFEALGPFEKIVAARDLMRELNDLGRVVRARSSQTVKMLRSNGVEWDEMSARTELSESYLSALVSRASRATDEAAPVHRQAD